MLATAFRRIVSQQRSHFLQSCRTAARYKRDQLAELWARRQILGPEPLKPRSSKLNWNYEAEVFAFGKRLGESFDIDTLKTTFIHQSYVGTLLDSDERDSNADKQLPIDNSDFIAAGDKIIIDYVNAFLRFHYPNLPEEGINAVRNHLTSVKNLANNSRHIGTTDLILTSEFPISDNTLRDSFAAVVGALGNDSGLEKAETFVRDFVLTQLMDVDVNELFNVANPFNVLKAILKKQGKGEPEPRLLRSSGSFSVLPLYIVGIYTDKELIGHSPGETLDIAVEMAARECLKVLWGTSTESRIPYAFRENIDFSHFKKTENAKLCETLNQEEIFLTNPVEPEPLLPEDMMIMYKDKIEKAFGKQVIKRMKHHYYYGTKMRNYRASFLKPKVNTI